MKKKAHPPVHLRPDVLATTAYRQGAAPNNTGFKLSSNENPFSPLPEIRDAIHAQTNINRYGHPEMRELRSRIAQQYGVDYHHIHLGAGSVSILYQLIAASCTVNDTFVYAWPSFEAYPMLGLACGAQAIAVPVNQHQEHDLNAMLEAVTEQTRAIILCTPNNPTGPVIRTHDFTRFMAQIPKNTLVILDEAYREFVTDPEAVVGEKVFAQYPNLVTLRTFSKAYGLAGLRIGYAVGDPTIFEAAAAVGIPLSITGLAETAALTALEAHVQARNNTRIAELIHRRGTLTNGLRSLGLTIPESHGNFVWIAEGQHPAASVTTQALAADFAAAGTLVRAFGNLGVRITVGESESVPEVLRIVEAHLSRTTSR